MPVCLSHSHCNVHFFLLFLLVFDDTELLDREEVRGNFILEKYGVKLFVIVFNDATERMEVG